MLPAIGGKHSFGNRPRQVFLNTSFCFDHCSGRKYLCWLCLGYGLGIKVEDDDKGLLGVRVKFDEYTPDILRLFCVVDSLYDMIRMSPSANDVPLDELLYD